MFTGLITHVAEIAGVAQTPAGRSLTVVSPWNDVQEGESIAFSGVCLTVNTIVSGRLSVAAVGTTLDRTTIAAWQAGGRVNLERSLRAGDLLGGHLVQGHVDGVVDVSAVRRVGDALVMDLAMWEGADGLYVPQGSICVDGVSLTVHAIPSARVVSVSIVEYTRLHTTLGERREGDSVNVELDIVGKYVRQQVAPWSTLASVDH